MSKTTKKRVKEVRFISIVTYLGELYGCSDKGDIYKIDPEKIPVLRKLPKKKK